MVLYMCGITAIFSYGKAAAPINANEILKIRDYMSLRGPDGAGLWISDSGYIGLAHRRLAIIDLSENGYQPMAGKHGRLHIVFNGEIYNFRTLRQELQKKGYIFSSGSDTEVLLQLYIERGFDMVQDLRGMYSFAIWDEDHHGLFLARDPFGIKPLYFHNDGQTFRCASQVKALLAGGGINPTPEPAGHVGFFLWGSVPEPFTLYKNVFELPAGHTLWVDNQGARNPHKYFDIADEYSSASVKSIKLGDAQAMLGSALEDSVHHHLIADVPVGVFLSAGLDSSVITALAAQESPFIQSVTLGFDEFKNSELDETRLATKVAEQYGCHHIVDRITFEDFNQERERILTVMDQPSVDGINSYFVSRAAKQSGLKVVLSGLGGDELLGSYPSFRQIPKLFSLTRIPGALPGFGKAFRLISAPFLKRMTSPKYAGIFEYGGTYGGTYLLRRSLYMPWELPEIMDVDFAREGWETLQPILRMDDRISDLRGNHSKVSVLEITQYMHNTLLRDSDWAGMAHSLEIRVPLVDIDLFRALAPYLAQENVGLTKRDMKEVPEKPLPPEIVNRTKTGFSIPVQQWLEKDKLLKERPGLRGWAGLVYKSFGLSLEIPSPAHKKVLAVVPDAFGNNGGIAKYNRDMLTAISSYPDVGSVTAIPRLHNKKADHNDKPLNLLFDSRGIDSKWRFGMTVLRTMISNNHFDLILCGHINLLPLAYLVAKWMNLPVWCVIYGVDAWNFRGNWFLNNIVGRLDGVVSISETTKARFVLWSKVKAQDVVVVPNCYDPFQFGMGTKSEILSERYNIKDNAVLMTLGRLSANERYKGFDETLEVMPDLVKKIPELIYMIVGAGDDKERLQQKAKQLNIGSHIVFPGYIPESEKADHYRLADCYIMPSSGEGFGFVFLEALACGIPVIGSKIDGGRDALRDGLLGILVNPKDPKEIEEAVLQILTQKDKQVPVELDYFNLSSFRMRAFRLLDRIFEEHQNSNQH